MKKLVFSGLLFLLSCGGADPEQKLPVPSCETTYTYCEWDALRRDHFIALFYLRDCSYDYGVCIAKDNVEECKDTCESMVWMPSYCISSCFSYKGAPK